MERGGAPDRPAGRVQSDVLRGWCEQADIDVGRSPATTTTDALKIDELERANEMSLAASSLFARELDP